MNSQIQEGRRIRAQILIRVCRKPGLDALEIAEAVGRSKWQVERHLKALMASGLIHIEKDDRKYTYHPGGRLGETVAENLAQAEVCI